MSFGESVFSVGFIQKTAKGTYSSKEITEFHHKNSMGRHENTQEGKPPKLGSNSHGSGLAGLPATEPNCSPFRRGLFHRLKD
jgi:hypothetical protein